MSLHNNRRYFWLKLKKDFFSSKRIKKLRSLAGGDTFLIIYLKLQLLAVDKEGILTYDGLEDSFAEEVALDIDESPDNVKVTLAFLLKYGLCESSDNVNFFLPYCAENTGSETGAAQRMRGKKQQKLLGAKNGENFSPKSENFSLRGEIFSPKSENFSLRGEIFSPELELEKEIDKEEVVVIKKTSQDYKNSHLINIDNTKTNNQLSNICQTATTATVLEEFEKNIGEVTPAIRQRLGGLVDETGEKAVLDAIDEAAAMNVRNYKYVAAIARGHRGKKKENGYYKHIDPDCPVCHGTGEEVLEFADGTGEPIRIKCRRCFDPERKKARA